MDFSLVDVCRILICNTQAVHTVTIAASKVLQFYIKTILYKSLQSKISENLYWFLREVKDSFFG